MTTDLDPTLEEAARRQLRRLADAIDTDQVSDTTVEQHRLPGRRVALVAACVATIAAAAAGVLVVVTTGDSKPDDIAAKVPDSTTTSAIVDDDVPALFQGQWKGMRGESIPTEGWGPTLTVYQGPDHCSWEQVTFISLTWPPGFFPTEQDLDRQFVRDAEGVLSEPYRSDVEKAVGARFDPDAEPPDDARASGMHNDEVEIWFSPAQDDALYIRLPDGTFELWPLAEPALLCE